MAVRHAAAAGGYIMENQHEENRMRGIRVNKRGSGATSEENSTNGGRLNDLSMKLVGRGPYLCRSQVVCWRRHENYCVGSILRKGWTKESLHRRSVGAVSRWRCRRSQEKWIGWEVDMSQCSREGNFLKWSEDSDGGEKLENLEK